jgi:hypothetical protein
MLPVRTMSAIWVGWPEMVLTPSDCCQVVRPILCCRERISGNFENGCSM